MLGFRCVGKLSNACCFGLILFLCISGCTNASAGINAPEIAQLERILNTPETSLDYARVKLTIDGMVDPLIDLEAELNKIEGIVATIKGMYRPNAPPIERLQALKKYLYVPGVWNNNQAYQYDFDDPLGTKISNKLLPNYIKNKKGNCITMPLFFIILGERLGLDVTASIAPLHVFVKYRGADGQWYNLETTSGANVTRSEWYRQQMPMTDLSIKSGIYLQPLTYKETIAVMMTVLAEHYFEKGEYEKTAIISDVALKYYPKNVNAMLRAGGAYYQLLKREFMSKYPNPEDIPINQRKRFHLLSNSNRYWFAKAEELGWKEPSVEAEAEYLERVREDSR